MRRGVAAMQEERVQATNRHVDVGFLSAYAHPDPTETSNQTHPYSTSAWLYKSPFLHTVTVTVYIYPYHVYHTLWLWCVLEPDRRHISR